MNYTRKMREFEILIFVYFLVATCCAAALEPQLLHARNPGIPKLAIVSTPLNEKGEVNPYFCDAKKTAAIQNAVKWMHHDAGSASQFLGQRDAGHTAAFVYWLGSLLTT
ncbi:hypothetical protein LZ31DRAFT_541710 [Colletotrichum somersetense]|nr:hypothetical protein LZ31DRAFT_541710 [Colletotrichum somersetense]